MLNGNSMSTEFKYNALMLDIETLSTKPNAAVMSVAMIPFHTEKGISGKVFCHDLSINANMKLDRDIDPETIKWWADTNVRMFLSLLTNNQTSKDFIEALENWMSNCDINFNEAQIWANSPSFDCVILRSLLDDMKVPMFWKYSNERDCRTLKSLYFDDFLKWKENLIQTDFTPHNPISDCYYQINYVQTLLKNVK